MTDRRRTHLIDPEAFVLRGVDRPWCGAFGARYSPMVEHPDDADCARCLQRVAPWHRAMDRQSA